MHHQIDSQIVIERIRKFFTEKIEQSLLLEYKDIIKDIKKDGLKEEVEAIGKKYDATQQLLLKQQQFSKVHTHLTHQQPCDVFTELTTEIDSLLEQLSDIENEPDVIELKKIADKLTKDWLKKLHRSDASGEIKQYCENQLAIKYKAEEMAKNSHILDVLKISNPHISQLIVNKKQELQDKYEPNLWINHCAKNAKNVSILKTHISKLTHSSASSVNINANDYQLADNQIANSKQGYLITSMVDNPTFDFAYSSAGFASIANFLRTSCGEVCIGEAICADKSVLLPFAKDEEQAHEWQQAIKLAFEEKSFSAHELLKQVYFPVNYDGAEDYHLLCPLMSSSLAQAVDDRIWQTRQKDMPARIARKNKKHSDLVDISYPTTAKIQVTQSNHQNVSNLNGKRNGRLMLFSSAPPAEIGKNFNFNLKTQLQNNTVFNRNLAYKARHHFRALEKMLYAIQSKELEQNLQRKKHIIKLVEELVESVLMQVAIIQAYLSNNKEDISYINIEQQQWLDCCRENELWQNQRQQSNWEELISYQFAKWIDDSLQKRNKKISLGTQYIKQWQKILKPLLREFVAQTESISLEHRKLDKNSEVIS